MSTEILRSTQGSVLANKWLKFASFVRVIFLSYKDLWTTQDIPVIICYCNLPFDLALGFK